MKTHKDGSIMGHKFERANLGAAPFRFIGMEQKVIVHPEYTQPAGTCNYCGTGIRYCYWIESADGKRFYVGSDCVGHLGDTKLVAVVMSAERQRKNAIAAEKREAKRLAEHAAQQQEIERRIDEYRSAKASLSVLPHPNSYFAAQGLTMSDYYDYFERDGVPQYWKMIEAIKKSTDAAQTVAQ